MSTSARTLRAEPILGLGTSIHDETEAPVDAGSDAATAMTKPAIILRIGAALRERIGLGRSR
jgi:hypothetical protein